MRLVLLLTPVLLAFLTSVSAVPIVKWKNNLGATLTKEHVPRRIAPTDEGWQIKDDKPIIKSNRNLGKRGGQDLDGADLEFDLVVSSENCDPCISKIVIHARQDGQGRIIKFD